MRPGEGTNCGSASGGLARGPLRREREGLAAAAVDAAVASTPISGLLDAGLNPGACPFTPERDAMVTDDRGESRSQSGAGEMCARSSPET